MVVNLLHGICYAFFFATVYIFVGRVLPQGRPGHAQGLFNVMILGIGALVANSVCPYLLQEVFTKDGTTDFRGLFLVPLVIALVAASVLALFFKPPQRPADTTAPTAA